MQTLFLQIYSSVIQKVIFNERRKRKQLPPDYRLSFRKPHGRGRDTTLRFLRRKDTSEEAPAHPRHGPQRILVLSCPRTPGTSMNTATQVLTAPPVRISPVKRICCGAQGLFERAKLQQAPRYCRRFSRSPSRYVSVIIYLLRGGFSPQIPPPVTPLFGP